MDRGDKKVQKIFTTDDIRKQARNWSLAGDAGLLAYLEDFSEKLFNKTQNTNSKFNELVEYYEEIHKTVDNVTNQFLTLQNCQFVENRVYDEETPTEEGNQENLVTKNEKEKLLLQKYKEAVEVGVKLLDTHFEALHLPPNSDSDEDDNDADDGDGKSLGNQPVLWKAKNFYSRKKFPLLIGSSEWWEDDQVGLENLEESFVKSKKVSESESDLDIEPSDEKSFHISSSPSLENEKSISSKAKILYDSSEDLFGLNKSDTFGEGASDLFSRGLDNDLMQEIPDNNHSKLDENSMLIHSENNEYPNESLLDQRSDETTLEKNETAYKHMRVNNEFARELTAKLDGFKKDRIKSALINPMEKVENREEKLYEEDISRSDKFIQDSPNNELFSDEFKKDNLVSSKNSILEFEKESHLFDDSDKLFFDPLDNLFDSNVSKPKISCTRNNHNSNSKTAMPNSNYETDLFENLVCDIDDENDGDEKSLFLNSAPKIKTEGQNNKSTNFPTINLRKGNGSKLFDDFPESDDLDIFKTVSQIKNPLSSTIENSMLRVETGKEISAFDTDLFTRNETNQKMDDDDDDTLPDQINSNESKLPRNFSAEYKDDGDQIITSKTLNLPSSNEVTFEKQIEDIKSNVSNISDERKSTFSSKVVPSLDFFDNDAPLFLEKKLADTVSMSSSRSSLFDDLSASKSQLASVFEKDKSNSKIFEEDLFNLFDDSPFGKGIETDLSPQSKSLKMTKDQQNFLFQDIDEEDDFFKKDAQENKIFFKNSMLNEFDHLPNASANTSKSSSDDLLEEDGTKGDLLDGIPVSKKFDFGSDNNFFSGLEAEIDALFGSVTVESIEKIDVFKTVDGNTNSPSQTFIENTVTKLQGTKNDSDTNDLPKLNITDPTYEKHSSFSSNNISLDQKVTKSPLPLSTSSSSPQTDLTLSKPKVLNLKPGPDSIIPESNVKEKIIGKLNIPPNLKFRLETAIKPASSDVKFQAKIEKAETEPGGSTMFYEPSPKLLKCPSKDRVKIPGRRRPQSRHARQEAIKNSEFNFLNSESELAVSDDRTMKNNRHITDIDSNNFSNDFNNTYIDIDNNSSNVLGTKNKLVSMENDSASFFESSLPKSYPLSPSTDEEDFFNVPGLDKNYEEDSDLFKNNLFESRGNSVVDSTLLFDEGPVFVTPLDTNQIERVTLKMPGKVMGEKDQKNENSSFSFPQSAKQNLKSIFNSDDAESYDEFGVDDDCDDQNNSLFKRNTPSKVGIDKKKDSAFMGKKIKPLFDEKEIYDDEDSDDIFKTSTVETKNSPEASYGTENLIEKPLNEEEKPKSRSLSNAPFLDPLGLMSGVNAFDNEEEN